MLMKTIHAFCIFVGHTFQKWSCQCIVCYMLKSTHVLSTQVLCILNVYWVYIGYLISVCVLFCINPVDAMIFINKISSVQTNKSSVNGRLLQPGAIPESDISF